VSLIRNGFDGFSLELGPEVANIICDHCGHSFKSVNGFIKKDEWAYSVFGKWWDDSDSAVAERRWVYMKVWPSESGSGFEIRIEEPDGSRHVNFKNLGTKLSPGEARQSPLLSDFFAVADFAIDNDPAVLSYLSGNEINIAGRICKH